MDRWRLLRYVAIPVVILAGGLLATGQDARASSAECQPGDTVPCLVKELTYNSVTVTLTRNGYTGNWAYSVSGDTSVSCTIITGDSVTVQNLQAGKTYEFAAKASCSGPTSAMTIPGMRNVGGMVFMTPTGPLVKASDYTDTSIKLTISNYTANTAWYYKYTTPTGGDCTLAGTGTATTVTGLTANTQYVFKAYSDSTCQTSLSTVEDSSSQLTTLRTLRAKMSRPRVYTLNKTLYVEWDARSGAEGYNVRWRSATQSWDDTNRFEPSATTYVTIPGVGDDDMSNGTEYTVRIQSTYTSGSRFSVWSDGVKATPGKERLRPSNIGTTGARLNIDNHRIDPNDDLYDDNHWWYKYTTPEGGTCSGATNSTGETKLYVDLSNLNSGTTYTFQAYKNQDCTSLLGDPVTFKTAAPLPPPRTTLDVTSATITETTASLAIANYGGSWYYKRTQPTEGDHPYGTCSAAVTGTSVNLTGLRADTSYTFTAFHDKDCTSFIDSYSFTTAAPPPAVNLSTLSLTLTEGTTDSYTVRLNSQPTDTVTVALESSDTTVATVSPTTLSFKPSNWDQTQNVTVTGLDNAVDGQDRAITISHNPSGGDYDSLAPVPLAVSVTDDDARGVSLSTSSLTLTEGTTDSYTVRLDSQPTDTVTVALESSDTTVATVSPTTLSFKPSNWDQTQNVTVTGTKDADTQDAVITIRHDPSGGDYGGLSGPQLTVTVEDLGPLVSQRVNQVVQDVVPDLNRAVTANTTHAVAQRVAQVSHGALSLGDTRISWGNLPTTAQGAMALARRWTEGETISVAALLHNSSFNTSFSPQGENTATAMADGNAPSPWGVWGTVDYGQITSGEDQSTTEWDAALLSALLGADRMVNDHLLTGAALAWSSSSFDYHTNGNADLAEGSGEGRLQLLSVHPYLGWRLDDGKSLWASVGYGWGHLTIDDDDAPQDTSTDLKQWSLATGASGILYQSNNGEPAAASNQLLWKTDAWFSSLHVAGNDVLHDDQQQAYRLRLGLEGNRSIILDNQALLSPSLGVFYRYEGGDGTTGSGLDLAAALRYETPTGLQLEGKGRTLLLHSEGLKDWGVSGLLRYSPRGNDGFSITLSPKWGRTDANDLQQLWSNHQDQLSTTGDVSSALLLDAELRSPRLAMGSYVLTPALGFRLSPDARTTRLGTALQLHDSLNLKLHLSRQQPDEGHANHSLGLNLHMDF